MDVLILTFLVLVGLFSGTAAGLFGVGGGTIVVPFLVLTGLLDFRTAVAASLAVIVVTAPLGVRQHARAHNVDWKLGLGLGLAGFVGVLAGGVVGSRVGDRTLMVAFAALLALAARNLAYGRVPHEPVRIPGLLLATGFLSGLLAKLFGIGGGIVMVPAMVFSGFDVHVAIGTSLLAVLTNAAGSTILNLPSVALWLPFVPALVLGALVGIVFGSLRSIRAAAADLRRGFAIFLTFVSIGLASQAFGS